MLYKTTFIFDLLITLFLAIIIFNISKDLNNNNNNIMKNITTKNYSIFVGLSYIIKNIPLIKQNNNLS